MAVAGIGNRSSKLLLAWELVKFSRLMKKGVASLVEVAFTRARS
jgi:hypothetical protein